MEIIKNNEIIELMGKGLSRKGNVHVILVKNVVGNIDFNESLENAEFAYHPESELFTIKDHYIKENGIDNTFILELTTV